MPIFMYSSPQLLIFLIFFSVAKVIWFNFFTSIIRLCVCNKATIMRPNEPASAGSMDSTYSSFIICVEKRLDMCEGAEPVWGPAASAEDVLLQRAGQALHVRHPPQAHQVPGGQGSSQNIQVTNPLPQIFMKRLLFSYLNCSEE